MFIQVNHLQNHITLPDGYGKNQKSYSVRAKPRPELLPRKSEQQLSHYPIAINYKNAVC